MTDDAVIGYVTGGWNRNEFTASLLAVCMEGETRIRTVIALSPAEHQHGPEPDRPRVPRRQPRAVAVHVRHGHVIRADTVDRLIAAADPVVRPVMGALCFSLSGGVKYPTMYELVEGAPGGWRSGATANAAGRVRAAVGDGRGVPAGAP